MAKQETIVGIAAGMCTAISLLPQLIKMIKEKKATDISILMLLTLVSGLCLWIWYGKLKKDWAIIVTNGVSLVINILIIILRQFYKQQSDGTRQYN